MPQPSPGLKRLRHCNPGVPSKRVATEADFKPCTPAPLTVLIASDDDEPATTDPGSPEPARPVVTAASADGGSQTEKVSLFAQSRYPSAAELEKLREGQKEEREAERMLRADLQSLWMRMDEEVRQCPRPLGHRRRPK